MGCCHRTLVLRSRQGPPFRAARRADPDVQRDRIRLLLRVFGINVFVWIRAQNSKCRDPACGELRAAKNGEHRSPANA